MRPTLIGAIAAIGLFFATAVTAAPLKLVLANPQPTASQLKNGLSVRYGYAADGQHIKSLADAAATLRARSEPGPPLTGLDYRDTQEGERTLTSKRALNVAAAISGYVRFDKPGNYEIDFLTNDGLRVTIGGQQVGLFDGRQPCDTTRIVEVQVPEAGWYQLEALYFQRLGTSCLHMRIAPEGGSLNWVPNSAFAYK
jgi:PA14 domain